MPKIDAATVAEHRAARRAALLDAAVDLLRENPEAVPSLADAGQRAGLSRSSVYHYFNSNRALMAAVVDETFPRWQRRFDEAYATAASPGDRVRAYVHENLKLVADGEHALARALVDVVPRDELATQSAVFHSRLTAPLAAALAELGEPHIEFTAELVNSLVLTGARHLEAGVELDVVEQGIERVLGPFLDRATATPF